MAVSWRKLCTGLGQTWILAAGRSWESAVTRGLEYKGAFTNLKLTTVSVIVTL